MTNKLFFIFTLALFCCFTQITPVFAQEEFLVSPINSLPLVPAHTDEFKFIVGGHLYGSHNASIYPASSLLANIENLQNQHANFFVSLGDMVQRPTREQEQAFLNSFAHKLQIPFFNALGNHDQTTELFDYTDRYYTFNYGNSTFIFLDSVSHHGNIIHEQLDFLTQTLKNSTENPSIQNIFIFTHYLIWSPDSNTMRLAYTYSNSVTDYQKTNFYSDIYPLLGEKPTYIFSGDVGTNWSYPLFYTQEESIHYIATGIGDTPQDSLITVSVNSSTVVLEALPLHNKPAQDISFYNTEFLTHTFPHQTIWEMLKKKLSKQFFFGFFGGIFFSIILGYIYKKVYANR